MQQERYSEVDSWKRQKGTQRRAEPEVSVGASFKKVRSHNTYTHCALVNRLEASPFGRAAKS